VIRVVVADDHAMVRGALVGLLDRADDIEVVGAARNGEEAVAVALESTPDLVLMDLEMPGVDGVAATRRLAREAPGVRVVVLTSFSDRERILDALEAGAVGYLLKDTDHDELLDALRIAHRGDSPLAPRAATAVLTKLRNAAPALTGREEQVLRLIGAGLPNKRIAMRLGITEQTVKSHVTRIFERIGVRDRTNAALWAQRHGLADPG
jgi:DNA-binding NarL/FixJ family response regulator